MFRIALTALAIYFIWKLIKWVFAGSNRNKVRSSGADKLGPAEMVACAGCGTFVINAEAISRGGVNFCSEDCANKT